MHKNLIVSFSFIFLIMTISVGQQKREVYLDSLSTSIQKFSNKEQLKQILNIPYDKAVTNIDIYEKLTLKAQNIAITLNDSAALANAYDKQSLALHFTSQEEKAISLTLKSIQIYETLKDWKNVGNAYTSLGWKLKHRDLNKAFDYMLKGMKILEKKAPNDLSLSSSYNNYGVLHQYKKQWDSAYYYHHKSLQISKQKQDSIGIPFAYNEIAFVYLKTKQYQKSLKFLDSSFLLRKKRNDIYGITDSYLYYGDLYYAKKDYKNAIKNFQKGLFYSTNNNYYPLRKYATEYLYKSYTSQNKHKEALKYYELYVKMKDSVLNTATNNKISELEIEYKTVKKEKEIAQQKELLLAKELKLQNRNLYAILLSAAFLILGILSFEYYKRNQLKNKQLKKEIHLKEALSQIKTQNQLQEQRLRISRDLHDNIGSQLTFIISSVDNLKYITKDSNDKLKNKLSTISSFTSDTIFQLRDTIWAMNKFEITFEDLHARILSFIEKAKTVSTTTLFEVQHRIESPISFTSIIGMNVFRVFQEAINNAIKYADATQIKIEIKKEENLFIITINDDGKGFDLEKIDLGNGLRNMEKRMNDINGQVIIKSHLGKGTKISIVINT